MNPPNVFFVVSIRLFKFARVRPTRARSLAVAVLVVVAVVEAAVEVDDVATGIEAGVAIASDSSCSEKKSTAAITRNMKTMRVYKENEQCDMSYLNELIDPRL